MNVKEFTKKSTKVLSQAAESSEPIPIDNRDKPYTALVSAPRLEQMQAAEDIVQGLLRLAGRSAAPSEYQAYAEALEDMARAGRLNIAKPKSEPATAQ